MSYHRNSQYGIEEGTHTRQRSTLTPAANCVFIISYHHEYTRWLRPVPGGNALDPPRTTHLPQSDQNTKTAALNGQGVPNMIWESAQELLPIACLPEAEALHLDIIVPHWGVSVRRAMQVKLNEFLEVCPHNLVRIDEDDFL